MRYFSEAGLPCRVDFQCLQIAMDLMSYNIVVVDDHGDCPLTAGSRRGTGHVRKWEDAEATLPRGAPRTQLVCQK